MDEALPASSKVAQDPDPPTGVSGAATDTKRIAMDRKSQAFSQFHHGVHGFIILSHRMWVGHPNTLLQPANTCYRLKKEGILGNQHKLQSRYYFSHGWTLAYEVSR